MRRADAGANGGDGGGRVRRARLGRGVDRGPDGGHRAPEGRIYRHFESKEALALEAFDHVIARMAERFAAPVGALTSSRA